jgi:hypothetical protein
MRLVLGHRCIVVVVACERDLPSERAAARPDSCLLGLIKLAGPLLPLGTLSEITTGIEVGDGLRYVVGVTIVANRADWNASSPRMRERYFETLTTPHVYPARRHIRSNRSHTSALRRRAGTMPPKERRRSLDRCNRR